ncbi:MAG: FtsX-like permease family protein [Treponema sp.]|nr:FtsX-like permease family protein [Treponema sp.]
MDILKLALRNLLRQKKRTILLGSAIAFGIMIVTIINGFAGAFIDNISENFANLAAGHIFIQGVEKSASGRESEIIRDDSLLMQAIKDAGIPAKYISKRSSVEASLTFASKQARTTIDGIDFANETYLPDRLMFVAGGMDGMKQAEGIIIAEPIAKRLDVRVGDRVLAQVRTVSGQQNVAEFAIAGITVDTGVLGSMAAYANKSYVNQLLNIGPTDYQLLGIYLPSLKGMDRYGLALYNKVKAVAPVFDRDEAKKSQNFVMAFMNQGKTQTWQGIKYRVFTLDDMLAQVKQIADVLNTSSLVILLILFLIIMVGITNTFRIILYERIREIGTMRSIGMQRGEVRNLFLAEAGFLALGGAIAGLILAFLIMGGVGFYNFGTKTPLFMVLKNGHMTFLVAPARMLANVVIVAILTEIAAFFPSRKAARLDPAVALRTVK